MALVFAGVTAHTPLLMPTIGKDALSLIDRTVKSMQALEQALYLSHPETIIVISPHGPGLPDAVVCNMNPEYTSNFEEFGDLVTKFKWKSDIMLIDRLREDFKSKHLPMALDSTEHLDYGAAVPLFYLTQHLPNIKVVPMVSSQLDVKTHFEFGRQMKDEIMSSTRRIAVIASADLSHRASENSPAGLSPKGVALDDKVIDSIVRRQPISLLDIDEAWANEAQACGLKSLAILGGLMDGINHETRLLSYEKPFGVGYVVAEMLIQ